MSKNSGSEGGKVIRGKFTRWNAPDGAPPCTFCGPKGYCSSVAAAGMDIRDQNLPRESRLDALRRRNTRPSLATPGPRGGLVCSAAGDPDSQRNCSQYVPS